VSQESVSCSRGGQTDRQTAAWLSVTLLEKQAASWVPSPTVTLARAGACAERGGRGGCGERSPPRPARLLLGGVRKRWGTGPTEKQAPTTY
jgi:hypothetical protein